MTRRIRQKIVDEMMYRLAELLPHEYRAEHEKVTGFEYFSHSHVKYNQQTLHNC
jgi:hypothetical protein